MKHLKNTHGSVLLLVKLQASDCHLTKGNTPSWVLFKFLKLCKWYQIAQSIANRYDWSLTHYSLVLPIYTLWEHQKTLSNSFLQLMLAIVRGHASTWSTSLMRVKNSMRHFCLWHLLSGTLEWRKWKKDKTSNWILT